MTSRTRTAAGQVTTLALLTVGFFLLVLPTAGAYIDPGSGSFVFQVLVGSMLAAGMAIKVYWRRIVGFLFRTRSESRDDA